MIDGNKLKALRQTRGLTARRVAQDLDLNINQVYRYEGNKTDVTSETLLRFAQYFDVSTDYLLGVVNVPGCHCKDDHA